MNIQNLYYYIAVAEDLNISKTAKRLYITQQALSEKIKKLENEYDSVFFERTPRLKLTYKGELMLAYAKSAVKAEQNLKSNLKSEGDATRLKLSIGASGTRGRLILTSAIPDYIKHHPNIIFSTNEGSLETIRNQFQMNLFDIYLGPYYKFSSESVSERLTRDYMYFVVSDELIEKSGQDVTKFIEENRYGISVVDASIFPIAMPPYGMSLRTSMELAYLNEGVVPNIVMETTSSEMMFEICSSGFCSSYTTYELLYHRIKSRSIPKNLHYFPSLGMGELTYYGIAYKKGVLPEYVSDFIDCCKKVLYQQEKEMNSMMIK